MQAGWIKHKCCRFFPLYRIGIFQNQYFAGFEIERAFTDSDMLKLLQLSRYMIIAVPFFTWKYGLYQKIMK